jgi:hypothetical protein
LREQWGKVTGEFDIEHFLPQVNHPEKVLDYDNLLFSCRTCNLLKGARELPDPFLTLTTEQLRVQPNGTIEGITKEAKRIIRVLGLDSDSYNRWRQVWIRNVELALEHDRAQFVRLMGFPEDLPDLAALRPPKGNSRPDGVDRSWLTRRDRGDLPRTY